MNIYQSKDLSNLFNSKITATVTKSSHQDHDNLHLPISLTHTLSSSAGKLSYDCCFPQQVRPWITTTV